jgi:hypothetical protein
MRIKNWYRNDNIDTFRRFCIHNRNKLISLRLIDDIEPIKGILYDFRLEPLATAGIFILLTDVVIHPAFYSLDDLESLHYLGSGMPLP